MEIGLATPDNHLDPDVQSAAAAEVQVLLAALLVLLRPDSRRFVLVNREGILNLLLIHVAPPAGSKMMGILPGALVLSLAINWIPPPAGQGSFAVAASLRNRRRPPEMGLGPFREIRWVSSLKLGGYVP